MTGSTPAARPGQGDAVGQVAEKIDRGRRRAVLAASIGNLIEAYDLLLYGYLASVLAEQFFPAGDPTAALLNTFAIFAVGFAVRPVGGLVFGHIGDRFGRRRALAASILLMGAGTLAIGLLPTYATAGPWAPALLLLCRLAQGFSVGGEYVGANILVLEHAPAGKAGRTASINLVAGYLGVAAASATSLLLARTLSPADLADWGWRLPFLVAGPLALIGLYLRVRIPDSPAFTGAQAARLSFPLAAAFRTAKRGMLIYGGWQMMVSLGGFLLFGYMASYLIRVVGLDPAGAFTAGLVAVLIVAAGAVAGGRLVDRFPLRPIALVAAAGIAVTVVPGFLLVRQGGVAAAIAGQAVWAIFVGVGAIVSAVLAVVLFPVQLRFTATAVGYNISTTVVGSTAPYVSAWLVADSGNPNAPAWYLAVVASAGFGTALVGLHALGRRG
jgi:MFS transporter, MHS family, proline/betaine transporter